MDPSEVLNILLHNSVKKSFRENTKTSRSTEVGKDSLNAERYAYSLGRVVAFYRRFQGLTQVEFAAKSGISRATVAKLERGIGYNPNLETISRVVQNLESFRDIGSFFNTVDEVYRYLEPSKRKN
tara:strand:- start:207 stop:581 length:375 start_codon:yes stop_codon:yes gene_type:complete